MLTTLQGVRRYTAIDAAKLGQLAQFRTNIAAQ
jgi:hypothetical protein